LQYHHDTLAEAFRYLIEKRPQIYPNDGFMLQLLRYEKELIQSWKIALVEEAAQAAIATDSKNSIETSEEFKKKEGV
jgi:hypothetical protein